MKRFQGEKLLSCSFEKSELERLEGFEEFKELHEQAESLDDYRELCALGSDLLALENQAEELFA
jgi:hypothetical protein